MEALRRARIPYVPVHADHIDRDGAGFSVLVLPNVGALSDAQAASIRRFVAHGGALIATGVSSLYDEWGGTRPDFALAGLFGAHATGPDSGRRARICSRSVEEMELGSAAALRFSSPCLPRAS